MVFLNVFVCHFRAQSKSGKAWGCFIFKAPFEAFLEETKKNGEDAVRQNGAYPYKKFFSPKYEQKEEVGGRHGLEALGAADAGAAQVGAARVKGKK